MCGIAIGIVSVWGHRTMNEIERIEQIVKDAASCGASDIHLIPGAPIMYRIDGAMTPVTEKKISPFEVSDIMKPVLTEKMEAVLETEGEVDFAHSFTGLSRIRINVFRQRGTIAATLRILSAEIPGPETLGLPQEVINLTDLKRGLVIVTGSAGSGKSTTLAALVNEISKKYVKSIITLEDPIEYLLSHNKSVISQREIGYDTKSYAGALQASLRQDPDVILIGELRDMETIQTAITAAETGHLVFSSLHTNNVVSTIERLVDVFPPYQQQQVRVQLADVVKGVISQQLLPKIHSKGRVAAYEVLLANQEVRSAIRNGKTHNIPGLIQNGRREGMQAMDDAIYDLYMKSYISSDTAIKFAQERTEMSQKVTIF